LGHWIDSEAPHSPQNLRPGSFSEPQFEQFIVPREPSVVPGAEA
jgi:hypothetical protein